MEQNKDSKSSLLLVARIGRLVGLCGGLKLYILSDFPEIFKPHTLFHTTLHSLPTLRISSFNKINNTVIFDGFTTRESATKLVNCELYSTLEESREMCGLQEGEFLWEELVGADVCDGEEKLGCVKEIERIGKVDYFVVRTNPTLIAQGFAKEFYIPYIEPYVIQLTAQKILTRDTRALLETS